MTLPLKENPPSFSVTDAWWERILVKEWLHPDKYLYIYLFKVKLDPIILPLSDDDVKDAEPNS